MRDSKRIDRILSLIREIWEKNPDLRLCQLIGNCFPACDNYHKEDSILEKRLIEYYMQKPEPTQEKSTVIKEYDKRHGGPWDRGSADRYYGRPRDPHKYKGDTGVGPAIMLTDADELEAYNAGYDNETDRKY